MNITRMRLQKQIEWAITAGWLPFYEQAVETIHPPVGAYYFDVADLMAITSRETGFNPIFIDHPGDRGNAFGPMQIDKRAHPDFIKSGQWKNPRLAILEGARDLDEIYDTIQLHEGRALAVKDSHTGKRFATKAITLDTKQRRIVALAGYNCGMWALYNVSKGLDVDHSTTGRDYASDVNERAAVIRQYLLERNK